LLYFGRWNQARLQFLSRISLANSVTNDRPGNYIARITNDGALVAFQVQAKEGISVVPSTGGIVKKVCDNCYLRGWLNHERRLLTGNLELLDPETGQKQVLLEQKQIGPWTGYFSAPRTSWDDRWIAFYKFSKDGGRAQIWVAPVHPGRPSDPSEWIPITDGNTVDMLPEFSPDGSRLYFFSQRDGARCIWVQRLDPATKKPVGGPEPVHHFHNARRSPIYNKSGQNSLAVARNKIALQVTERLGNIWLAEYPR
jgi:Tol biopolymer transport system component